MSNTNDLTILAARLAMVTDRIEAKLVKINEQNLAASNALASTSRDAQRTADAVTRAALERLREEASSAIVEGMSAAMSQCNKSIADGAYQAHVEISRLEEKLRQSSMVYSALAWKAFLAVTLASIAVAGTAAYWAWQAKQEVRQAQWSKELLIATAAGKLATCPEGGLCAMVNKKWVRVD